MSLDHKDLPYNGRKGNPLAITAFPAPDAIEGYSQFKPDPARLMGGPRFWVTTYPKRNRLRFMRLYPHLRVHDRLRSAEPVYVVSSWRHRCFERCNWGICITIS